MTDIEELIDALHRMPLRWETILTYSDFERELERVFAELDRTPTARQLEAFWEASGVMESLEEHGIRVVSVTYPWGQEYRYAIQGMPGLWGRWAVEKIKEEEGWETPFE